MRLCHECSQQQHCTQGGTAKHAKTRYPSKTLCASYHDNLRITYHNNYYDTESLYVSFVGSAIRAVGKHLCNYSGGNAFAAGLAREARGAGRKNRGGGEEEWGGEENLEGSPDRGASVVSSDRAATVVSLCLPSPTNTANVSDSMSMSGATPYGDDKPPSQADEASPLSL